MTTDTAATNADPAVRPFHVSIADEAIVDLRRRIAAWRPPEREPVDDQSQGVQLATVQDLVNYWATEYDWRRCAAKLNTLDQFITSINGLDIHFIHVKSPQQDALPLIVSHGWPGSIIEQLKIIEPLTNPTEHGGSAPDAFDLLHDGRRTAGCCHDRDVLAFMTAQRAGGQGRLQVAGEDWAGVSARRCGGGCRACLGRIRSSRPAATWRRTRCRGACRHGGNGSGRVRACRWSA
jgi:Epoxide hydrolase N terminus